MNRIFPKRGLLALVLSLALVLGSVPAYGLSAPATVPAGDTITANAYVGSVNLHGLTDAEARVKLGSVRLPVKPLTVMGDSGKKVVFSAGSVRGALHVTNVEAMLAQAHESTGTVRLVPSYAVKAAAVTKWTALVSKKLNHKAKDAKRYVKGKKLLVAKERSGHLVRKATTSARITTVLASQIASPGATPKVAYPSLKVLKPKVTRKNLPKAILVVLSKFSVTLYKGTKVEKKYKCATGMPGYATPTGKWKVTRKVKNPSWHNPGSAWGRGMPSVIGPGPSNPLGTRAIYLNASGIRIHGTSKSNSIGHRASHGCMRMRRHDIENLYPRVPVGITVWIIK